MWVRGVELTSDGPGVGTGVLRRTHRSGGGYNSAAGPLAAVSSTVAVFEAPVAPPGTGPATIFASHPAIGATSRVDTPRSEGGGDGSSGSSAGIMIVIVPEAPANLLPTTPSTAVTTAVTTEGGEVVTLATTLGLSSAAAACRVGTVGPMGVRIGAASEIGGGDELECVVPARAPGYTMASARPAALSWPEDATGSVTQLVVRLVPSIITAVAADGGLAAAAALSGGGSAARFTLFGYNLPGVIPRDDGLSYFSTRSCLTRPRPSASYSAALFASGSAACDFPAVPNQGFTPVAAAAEAGGSGGGHGGNSGWPISLPQVDIRAPPLVYAVHASSGPSGGGSVAHLHGAWSFGSGGGGGSNPSSSAGGEAGTMVCIFAATGYDGIIAGPGVVVSSAVASCEVPAWTGGTGAGGAAAVSLTRSSAEDASAFLLASSATAASAAVTTTATSTPAATAPGVGVAGRRINNPIAGSASFHFTPELAIVGAGGGGGPGVSPDVGSSGGGAVVVLSRASASVAATSTWRYWFGSVGPVLGAASGGGSGGGVGIGASGTCVSPGHAPGAVPVRACPAPSCGNGGDFGAASGAVFFYAHTGELLPGDDAAVLGSSLGLGGSELLLVGWGLGRVHAGRTPAGGGGQDYSGEANTYLGALAVASPPPLPSVACVVISSYVGTSGPVPALAVSSGGVMCGPLGAHPPGFHAVFLLAAGGTVASTPLAGAQVEFAEAASVAGLDCKHVCKTDLKVSAGCRAYLRFENDEKRIETFEAFCV